jgi:hypothetical protein
MERDIKDTIMNYMNTNLLWAPEQFGFRPGRSCQLQLLEVLEGWHEGLDMGKKVDVIYMDFAKAFDTVPHLRLRDKIEAYGIGGKISRWIAKFLNDRKQAVMVNGVSSDWTEVLSGVPQGSVLGLTMFLIYINDLPHVISNTAQLFADDTKMSKIFDSSEECISVQNDLDKVQEWASTWQLRFHPLKCKTMHIGKNPGDHIYTMQDSKNRIQLDTIEEEKDLGVHIDSGLTFDRHVAAVVSKAKRIGFLINRCFKHLDKQTFSLLYKGLVRPILEYAAPVWSPHTKHNIDRIESVQRKITKGVKDLKKKSYSQCLTALGLPTLLYRRERADMIQVFKLTHGLDDLDAEVFFNRDDSSRTRGHSWKLKKSRYNSSRRGATFKHRVVNAWNSLPEDVVGAQSTNAFKLALNRAWYNRPSKFNA